MGLARKRGIKVVEREIWPQEMARAAEIFLTGTAVEVQPVGEIDGREYPVGPVTQAVAGGLRGAGPVVRRSAMKSAVTISLVPEARGGPFVFWDDLAAGCRQAAALGFDAVELFPPGPDARGRRLLAEALDDSGLSLAAVGTGAGWVKHKLSLTSPDAAVRSRAKAFVRGIIDLAGPFGAPAIIGSMQGRWGEDVPKAEALEWLGDALAELGEHASAVRRAAAVRTAQPLRDEPVQHSRVRRWS